MTPALMQAECLEKDFIEPKALQLLAFSMNMSIILLYLQR
jgi:hypothetical protein